MWPPRSAASRVAAPRGGFPGLGRPGAGNRPPRRLRRHPPLGGDASGRRSRTLGILDRTRPPSGGFGSIGFRLRQAGDTRVLRRRTMFLESNGRSF